MQIFVFQVFADSKSRFEGIAKSGFQYQGVRYPVIY